MTSVDVNTYVRRVIDLHLESFHQSRMTCFVVKDQFCSKHIADKLRIEFAEEGITEEAVLVTWNSAVTNYFRCREQNKSTNFPYFEMMHPHFKDSSENFVKGVFSIELYSKERVLKFMKFAGKVHMALQLVFLVVYISGISVNFAVSDTNYITIGKFIMAGMYFIYLHGYSTCIALSARNGRIKAFKVMLLMIPITSALLLFLQSVVFSIKKPIVEMSTNATMNDWESSYLNKQCPVPLHALFMIHSVTFAIQAIWTYSNKISLGSCRPLMRKCMLMLHVCDAFGMLSIIIMLFGIETFYLFFVLNSAFDAGFVYAIMTTKFRNERLYSFSTYAVVFKYY